MSNELRIVIGASVGASVANAFTSVEKAAAHAAATIQKTMADSNKQTSRALAAGAAQAAGVYRQTGAAASAAAKSAGTSMGQMADGAAANFRRLSAGLKALPAELSVVAREAQRAFAQIEKEKARAALGLSGSGSRVSQYGGGPAAGRLSGGGAIGIGRRAGIRVPRGLAAAYGYGGAAVSAGIGMTEGMLRGMGVNTDVESMIQAGVSNQAKATKVINSAPEFENASVGERRGAANELLSQAQSVGTATGTSTADTLEALDAFVAKTGDLKTAKDSIQQLATLSKATGTSLADMSNAAAEVSNNLGDVPNKGQAVYDVMRAVAGQGKLGAVEIKDLASQMAKVATSAGTFEGDRGQNIAMLGAMAQEAKLRGGAASASQATTAVTNFASQFATKATFAHWHKANLNPFTDDTHKTLQSPKELVMEALKYSKGDQTKLAELFPNKVAAKAVGGFQQIYKEAGGGDKGLAAVDAEFQRLASAAMSEAAVMSQFESQMKTSESQVAVFNNQMETVASQVSSALIPSLLKLAPMVSNLAVSFGNLAARQLGADRDTALEKARLLPMGTADKDKENLDKTTGSIDHGGGGAVKTYSAEALEVIKGHGVKRGQAIAELGGAIENENSKAETFELADKLDVTGLGARASKALGFNTSAETAEGLRGQAAGDVVKLEEMKAEQVKTNTLLHDIYSAILAGNAIQRPAQAGGVTNPPGGTADPTSK